MAIDIRADITCNLGTLISASISDSYIQESGLIFYTGDCVISGIIRPNIGDPVTFTYTKNGITRTIPRKLRVLSSFTDPFRRTTTISLGCKLTYLRDLKDKIDWSVFDDPINNDRTESEAEIVLIPIHASSVMNECLSQLGISASSNPLTNKFSIAGFDFSSGYVSILNDLLVSESYCGYLDRNEVLQVFSLNQTGGTGPVLNTNDLIDIGAINVGPLPGEAVTVSYSSLRLKQPEGGALSTSVSGNDWEFNQSVDYSELGIAYTNYETGIDGIATYNTFTINTTSTIYKEITTLDGERKKVVQSRWNTIYESGIKALGAPASAYLSDGKSFSPGVIYKSTTEYFWYDKNGNERFRESVTIGSPEYISGSAPVPWRLGVGTLLNPFVYGYLIPLSAEYVESNTINEKDLIGGRTSSTLTYTKQYEHWSQTVQGQQAAAENKLSFNTYGAAQNFVDSWAEGGLVLVKSSSNLSESGVNQVAPSNAAIVRQSNADDSGSSTNGYSTESSSELELVLGSVTAQRRIEFSLPYAPDDTFTKSGTAYYASKSDAPQKAQLYGRVQNNLFLGGRNGMNIQVSPERLPSAPFSPFIIQANGISGLYRTNGTNWTMDANGIVVSTDGLFWGGVGGGA